MSVLRQTNSWILPVILANNHFITWNENCLHVYFGLGIKLTLSALLDGKNINAGGHKLGLGLELEA